MQELCGAALQTGHYSLAVAPDGRFVAAGGRGLLRARGEQRTVLYSAKLKTKAAWVSDGTVAYVNAA